MKVKLNLGGQMEIEAWMRDDVADDMCFDLVSLVDVAAAVLHNKAMDIQRKAGQDYPPEFKR